MQKLKFQVTDVETAGSLGWPLIYDISWQILDKKGRVDCTRSFAIKEVYTNAELMTQAYYGRKVFEMYPFMFAAGRIQLIGWEEMLAIMREDISKHKVNVFSAYNAAFDIRAIRLTDFWFRTGIKSKEELLSVKKEKLKTEDIDTVDKWLNPPMPFAVAKVLDIYMLACQNIMFGKKFRQTALENLWLTPNGNYQTNAQVCWRYLSGDYSFIEKHTGIDDVEIESQILLHCLRKKKKLNYDKLEPACIISRLSQPGNGRYFHERIGATFTDYLNGQLIMAGIDWDKFYYSYRDVKWSKLLDEDICPASLTKKTVREWKERFLAKYRMAWDDYVKLPENFQKVVILMGMGIDWYVPDDEINPDLSPEKLRRYFEDKKELNNGLPRLAAKTENVMELIKEVR